MIERGKGDPVKIWLAFAALGVIWGVPYFFIRIAVQEVSPLVVVWGRLTLAALVLLPIAIRRGAIRPLHGHLGAVATFALVEFVVPFTAISYGERWISSSVAGILIAGVPLTIAGAGTLGAGLAGADHFAHQLSKDLTTHYSSGADGTDAAGSLKIVGEGFSTSEKAVAQNLADQGQNVVLRDASGVQRMSDLLVNGTPYDVYTPEADTSVRNILSNVASKWTQVKGGGVVIDLSNTGLAASDFGENRLARVNGFVKSWGGIPLSDIQFYNGG